MKLGYFPGCSAHGSGRELDESLKAIAPRLQLELDEVEDWACCGSTSAHSTNRLLAAALPARTLALAEKQGHQDLLAPCAACYSRLATARHDVASDAKLRERVTKVLDMPFTNAVRVLNLVDLLHARTAELKAAASGALKGLKVACYYGCLLVRPAEATGCTETEAPTTMEDIVSALGGSPVSWPMKLECCGGGFSVARTGSVIRLGRAIIESARASGADVVVVACPMCHMNLDMRQAAMVERDAQKAPMPILFLTELAGLALGVEPAQLGVNRHFVSARALVERTRAAAAPAAPATGTTTGAA